MLKFEPVFENFDALLSGLVVTVTLSVAAIVVSFVLAVLLNYFRRRYLTAKIGIRAYIELIRNTPFLIQLFIVFFALPSFGISITPNIAAFITLFINLTAYLTEIVRSGIDKVPKGQHEAAFNLGMREAKTYVYIIAPQAIRNAYPSIMSQCIYLTLMTSVVSAISATDLTAAANQIRADYFVGFEVYIVASVFYLLISFVYYFIFIFLQKTFISYPSN